MFPGSEGQQNSEIRRRDDLSQLIDSRHFIELAAITRTRRHCRQIQPFIVAVKWPVNERHLPINFTNYMFRYSFKLIKILFPIILVFCNFNLSSCIKIWIHLFLSVTFNTSFRFWPIDGAESADARIWRSNVRQVFRIKTKSCARIFVLLWYVSSYFQNNSR